MAAILAASGLQLTKVGDTQWSAAFQGDRLPEVRIYISVFGDLVVSQGIVAKSSELGPDSPTALLELNFVKDLVKVSIQKDEVVALNETELRLLDGPGLKRIVLAVASCIDELAGSLSSARAATATPPPNLSAPALAGASTLSLLQGHEVIRFDGTKWKAESQEAPGEFQYRYSSGDIYVRVITERIQVPIEKMADIVLANARNADPNAKIVRQGYRNVNGLRMLYVELQATVAGIDVATLTHCYSDASGTVQLMGFTGRNLMNEARAPIEQFVSGFSVAR
jgi:hypothetical protein